MSVRNYWYNLEHTVLWMEFTDPWTLEEFYNIVEDNRLKLDTAQEGVTIVFDLSQCQQVPPHAFTAFTSAANRSHPHGEKYIAITNSQFVTVVANVFLKLKTRVGERMQLANSVEEALHLLQIAE